MAFRRCDCLNTARWLVGVVHDIRADDVPPSTTAKTCAWTTPRNPETLSTEPETRRRLPAPGTPARWGDEALTLRRARAERHGTRSRQASFPLGPSLLRANCEDDSGAERTNERLSPHWPVRVRVVVIIISYCLLCCIVWAVQHFQNFCNGS